ncbi:MAG: type I-G CRISPR-associated helicase/endonuclease Cas3g [Bryobacteraceae bacterium]
MTLGQGSSEQYFATHFLHLTGHQPFEWQKQLFAKLLNGHVPLLVDLPTGAGKTSVMVIWLLALSRRAPLPRRLVWVVDRRAVVDQATDEADGIANLLDKPEAGELRDALGSLSVGLRQDDDLLAISTLRGEREDNTEWSLNPTRPAIVVGTVDMVGSRLLFSGYGDSRKRRAWHASLLAQDALIVNDEAHLTPAFAHLLKNRNGKTGGERPLKVMLLSATHVAVDGDDAFPGDLESDLAHAGSTFIRRYRAVKRLELVESDKPLDKLRELAVQPAGRTLVYVRSPRDCVRIASAIQKQYTGAGVQLITGEQRGYERDQLWQKSSDGVPTNETIRRFQTSESTLSNDPPCWIIATSAGEVGIDLSSDRLLTDLDTADHLLQRFGRLNRFGETEGNAYVVYSPKQINDESDKAKQLSATLKYLTSLDKSVSPENLRNNPPPALAVSEPPNFAPLLPWHIDSWSLTSINASDWASRPRVEPWLRGDDEDEPPETYVAWREDVKDLAHEHVPDSDREEVFDVFPVLAHEKLKQYTYQLGKDLQNSEHGPTRAILLAADGTVQADQLDRLLEDRRLRYGILMLPPGIGYLSENGTVDWTQSTKQLTEDQVKKYDVADNVPDLARKRMHVRLAAGEHDREPELDLRRRCSFDIPAEDESQEPARWIYYVEQRSRNKHDRELLDVHQPRVSKLAADLAQYLGLNDRLVAVYQFAGAWHDLGKDRAIWQNAAGNRNGAALAKSERLNGRKLAGYRHELGSLIDAAEKLPKDFNSDEQDLALHLIAAHHGWARPHFEPQAWDKENILRSREISPDVTRRFGRLQGKYGPWGLAYLETVFRAADAIASADTPELPLNA